MYSVCIDHPNLQLSIVSLKITTLQKMWKSLSPLHSTSVHKALFVFSRKDWKWWLNKFSGDLLTYAILQRKFLKQGGQEGVTIKVI